MNDKTIIKLWAMSMIGALEAINMAVMHADGAIFAGALAAIAGLAGYTIAKAGEK